MSVSMQKKLFLDNFNKLGRLPKKLDFSEGKVAAVKSALASGRGLPANWSQIYWRITCH